MPEGGEFKSKAELIDKKIKQMLIRKNILQGVIIYWKLLLISHLYLCITSLLHQFYDIYLTHYYLIDTFRS